MRPNPAYFETDWSISRSGHTIARLRRCAGGSFVSGQFTGDAALVGTAARVAVGATPGPATPARRIQRHRSGVGLAGTGQSPSRRSPPE